MVLDVDELDPSVELRQLIASLEARDATIGVTVAVGEPPLVVDGCQVLELTFAWGAGGDSGVLTSADAGSGTLRLVDPLRLFDPTNEASPIVGAGVGSAIRVYLAGVPAFRGRIDDIDHDLTLATLALVDDIAALAAVQFVETAVPGETSSARVSRILDLAAWPADRRDIGAGGVALQAGTVASDAWSELTEVTRNELGALWLTPGGVVTWRNRAAAWASAPVPAMRFGCPPNDAFISELAMRSDPANVVNVLTAARRGGTARTVTDPDSLTRYGRHSHVQNDLELVTDGDRDLWQSFYLIRQASPARGVGGFAFRPDVAALTKTLGLGVGAIVNVFDEHHGPVIDRRARWVGARWTVAPAYIEVRAATGEDAAIRAVDRSRVIDTPAEWAAVTNAGVGTAANVTVREPGLQLTIIPKRPAGL